MREGVERVLACCTTLVFLSHLFSGRGLVSLLSFLGHVEAVAVAARVLFVLLFDGVPASLLLHGLPLHRKLVLRVENVVPDAPRRVRDLERSNKLLLLQANHVREYLVYKAEVDVKHIVDLDEAVH